MKKKEILALLSPTYELCYVDRGDSIGDWKVVQVCIHHNCYDALYEYLEGWVYAAQESAIEYIMERGDLKGVRLTPSQLEWVRNEILDRDVSNPAKELAQQTDVLLSYPFLEIDRSDYDDCDQESASALLADMGITEPTEKQLGWAVNVLGNSWGHGVLRLIFKSPLSDLVSYEKEDKMVIAGEVSVGFVDSWNGSGYVETLVLTQPITIPFIRERLTVDQAKGNGYTWVRIQDSSCYVEADIKFI